MGSLREGLIDTPIFHEFAYRCAEAALAKVENPAPRSLAAIETKRKWLRGEVSDEELKHAQDIAWAAANTAARFAAAVWRMILFSVGKRLVRTPGTNWLVIYQQASPFVPKR